MHDLAERGPWISFSGRRFEKLCIYYRVVSDGDSPPFAGTGTDAVALILEDIRVRMNALPGRPGVLERRSTGPKPEQREGQREYSEATTHATEL